MPARSRNGGGSGSGAAVLDDHHVVAVRVLGEGSSANAARNLLMNTVVSVGDSSLGSCATRWRFSMVGHNFFFVMATTATTDRWNEGDGEIHGYVITKLRNGTFNISKEDFVLNVNKGKICVDGRTDLIIEKGKWIVTHVS